MVHYEFYGNYFPEERDLPRNEGSSTKVSSKFRQSSTKVSSECALRPILHRMSAINMWYAYLMIRQRTFISKICFRLNETKFIFLGNILRNFVKLWIKNVPVRFHMRPFHRTRRQNFPQGLEQQSLLTNCLRLKNLMILESKPSKRQGSTDNQYVSQ